MNFRLRLLIGTDRIIAAVLATILAGATLAFGGAVWWGGLALAVLLLVMMMSWLLHFLVEGRLRMLRSPLTALGIMAIGLAIAQLVPLPPPLARSISPRSHQVYALGMYPDRVRALDPMVALPTPAPVRTPVSVDRAATLRWAAGATACLTLFWGVSQFTDRLRRLYLIWGSVIAAFSLNTVFAVVQLSSGSDKLYGMYEPGKGPSWGPSLMDLHTTPNATILRTVNSPSGSHLPWAAVIPDRQYLLGSMMGGPGAYLALAAIVLPLSLALVLQLMAPRGSRERLAVRLGESGHGSLVVLLGILLALSAVVVGLLAGPLLSIPFAVALLIVGLPSAWPSGLRWTGIGVTALALAGLGTGALTKEVLSQLPGASEPFTAQRLQTAARVWRDSLAIVSDFPLAGSGMGSFATVFPHYKSRDESQTTALSSVLQWMVESGAVGVLILSAGAIWCLVRLPGAIRRVGTADRALVFGLIGSAVGFSLYSALHWTVELAAVALAASALAGVMNRWLAGGTDLFVERG